MSYNTKWLKDLTLGNKGEIIVSSYLEKYQGYEVLEYNNDNQFDVLLNFKGNDIKLEVKTDTYEYMKEIITNNIFIETSCSGKLSGIHSTKSDLFAYYFPFDGEIFFIKIKDMKNLLKEHPEYFNYKSGSGDGGRVSGYVINRKKYRHLFNVKKITKLNPYQLNYDKLINDGDYMNKLKKYI